MSVTSNQVEAEWVAALSGSEDEIKRVLSSVPKDRLLEYTSDLVVWSQRLADEAIVRAYRVMNAQGYSKSVCATTLGIHVQTLTKLIDRHVSGTGPAKAAPRGDRFVPDDFIDLTEQFARAYSER
jgi:hypothetical protein